MRFSIFGDRHYSRRSKRADLIIDTWKWAIDDSKRRGAHMIVGVGDVCEGDPDGYERWILGGVYAHANPLRRVEVLGNHCAHEALLWLEYLGVEHVWNTITYLPMSPGTLVLVPYARYGRPPFDVPLHMAQTLCTQIVEQAIRTALDDPKWTRPVILIAHMTPEGATTRSTRFEVHRTGELVIPRAVYGLADLAVFAHIHKPQDDPLVVGSQTRIDFDEADDAKRYLIVETHPDGRVTWESCPIQGRQMVEKRLTWVPGMTIAPEEIETFRGTDTKLVIDIPASMAGTYREQALDPIRDVAASLTIDPRPETVERIRAPEIMEARTLPAEVDVWLRTTNLGVDRAALAPILEELELEIQE
jgi:hypothetical protein